MRGDELDDKFPASIAQALKASLKGKDGFYKEHPQLPGNDEAAMYKVMVKASESHASSKSQEQSTMFNATVTADAPKEAQCLVANMQQIDTHSSSSTTLPLPQPTKTPDEIAQEEEEKHRRNKEREDALKATQGPFFVSSTMPES